MSSSMKSTIKNIVKKGRKVFQDRTGRLLFIIQKSITFNLFLSCLMILPKGWRSVRTNYRKSFTNQCIESLVRWCKRRFEDSFFDRLTRTAPSDLGQKLMIWNTSRIIKRISSFFNGLTVVGKNSSFLSALGRIPIRPAQSIGIFLIGMSIGTLTMAIVGASSPNLTGWGWRGMLGVVGLLWSLIPYSCSVEEILKQSVIFKIVMIPSRLL